MSMELIKTLRERTHLGMNECKNALIESSNDLDKAIEILQKKGLKKVDDLIIPLEGQVRAFVGRNEMLETDFAYIIEINCQTDFGARSEVFEQFVTDSVSDPNVTPGMIKPMLEMVSKQLGEKVVIRRSQVISDESDGVVFCAYNHLGGKIAVVLEAFSMAEKVNNSALKECLENIAMQIAAMKPIAISRDTVPSELVEKQRIKFESEITNKPEAIKAKIVDGKMNKWYAEIVLLDQEAIFLSEGSPKQTIQAYLDKLGAGIVTIREFLRYERGEEVKNAQPV